MKRGTTREDGKVFSRISKGKEIWLTKEQYDKREISRKQYVRNCIKSYYSRRKSVRKIGEFNHNKNLYFCGISTSGKEVWKNKKYLDRIVKAIKASKQRYVDRCKKAEPTNLKFGDKHPVDPNLYVIFKVGNKCFFGSKKKLEQKKESLRKTYVKRHFKAKKIRSHILHNMVNRKIKGDKREEDNKIFWEYNRVGKEIWLDPEIFHLKRNKSCEKRKNNRIKKKLAMLEKQNTVI